jgi:hypothetical protein
MSETNLSYASFGNARKRLASERFTQELVVFKDIHLPDIKLKEDFQIFEATEPREVGRIIHRHDSHMDAFQAALQEIRKEHSFFVYFSLDGQFHESMWINKKSKELLSVLYTEPSICWICNRIFMTQDWHYFQNCKWSHGADPRPWCSRECQVRYASVRLAYARKSQRHSTDKTTTCKQCSEVFTPKRLGAEFCSAKCRLRSFRQNARNEEQHDG